VKSLQEVTSQEESFMPDISGYIQERVKRWRVTCMECKSKQSYPSHNLGMTVCIGLCVDPPDKLQLSCKTRLNSGLVPSLPRF